MKTELEELKKKADELYEKARRTELDYVCLQNKIRKEVLKDFDVEYYNLQKKLLQMKRDRRNITKKAYNKNAKLRWLRKKKKELWDEVSKCGKNIIKSVEN